MARQLKTYLTSIGFFDLAIAAPSMKAALAAWGAASNLFHQGFARQTDDPAIVAATRKHPGTVLRRPIGSHGPFTHEAPVPNRVVGTKPAARKTAAAAEASRRKKQRQRENQIAKTEKALASAKAKHDAKLNAIARQREALDRQAAREDERWRKQQDKLKASLRNLR